jgi:HK97 family phage major capsid protein
MPLSDFGGVIPPEYSSQIIQEATVASAALSLGRRVPMGTSINEMPVPRALPTATFTTAASGRKNYTNLAAGTDTLRAEEIAAVIGVPNKMIDDPSINIWAFCRPLLAQAIAVGLDMAVFWGAGAPTSWGMATGLYGIAQATTAGNDPVDTINKAMSLVEGQGLNVTGHAADTVVRGFLRGVRDDNGSLLLGEGQAATYSLPTLYGLPVAYTPFSGNTGAMATTNYFTGNWQYLAMGVRQDIRFETSTDGVIVNAAGTTVEVSAFQDNVTLMKVWARFACVVTKPVTPRVPAGANPFARAPLTAWVRPSPPPLAADEGEGSSRSRKS